MLKNNLLKNSIYLLLLILSLFLIIFRNTLQSKIVYFLYPNEINTKIVDASNIQEELNLLKIENTDLKSQVRLLERELGLKDDEMEPSYIKLLLGPSFIYNNFYVSKPEGKTVYKDMNIFTTQNVVVGRVDEIQDKTLKVKYLGFDQKFTGIGETSEESVELGALSVGLYAGKVSGGSKIEMGENIVLNGFPTAIIGTVIEIEKSDNTLSNILVRSPLDLRNKKVFYVLQ